MSENTVSDQELADLQGAKDNVIIKEISISSAEVLALNASPKLLIPAQGPNKVIEFLSALLILDFATAAYALNGTLQVQTVTGNAVVSDLVLLASFLDAAADRVTVVQALSAEVVDLDINEGLELFMPTGETGTGDSPIKVRVSYRVHDTGL